AESNSPADPDAVPGDDAVDLAEHFWEVADERGELWNEIVGDVRAHAADARQRRRKACTDPRLEHLINDFALLERPEERRERADVDARGAQPDEVRDDARHLARHHAQH